MKYNNNKSYIKTSKLYHYILINLILFFFIINGISSKEFMRPDVDPYEVLENILAKIHTNFFKNKQIYKEIFSEYSISMNIINLKIEYESINKGKYDDYISLIHPNFEFILGINITNNNDMANNPDNHASIIFNPNINSPILDFKLENLYAQIKPNFLQFTRNYDNTYNYSFYDIQFDLWSKVYFDINLDIYKYIPKIYNIFKRNEKEFKLFLYNSFCSYIDEIISIYPESDGVYLYEKIIENILSVKTFALDISENPLLEKIYFNNIKQETYYNVYSEVKIINFNIDFDLIFEEGKRIEKYNKTIPQIFVYPPPIFIHIPVVEIEVANTNLCTLIENIFFRIIENYLSN